MSVNATAAPTTDNSWGPEALDEVREARRKHQEATAERRHKWILSNRYFYDRLKRVLKYIVEPRKRVLEIRCETGQLLASVAPSYGVGVEISDAMVECAGRQFPEFHFVRSDPESLQLNETFDYILFNHIFDTVDILRAFESVRRHCSPETKVVVINYNQLWQPILEFASKVGLRSRFVEPNWVSENDLRGFLKLAGFRVVHKHRIMLLPKWIPLLSSVMNDFVGRLPGLRRLCLMQVMVGRALAEPKREEDLAVSVVIPCRNEAGNIQHAVERLPAMGRHTEILFCDDKSTDGTADEIRRMQELYPWKDIRLVEGPGICKAENVWTGFRAARGDVLMILDADLTVMPEELPVFLRALATCRAEFVNGSRLVYPMPDLAMKFANIIGNKLFGVVFSYLLDQRIKDTLCGTKVFWRKDWARMEINLGGWGIKDLWGDYELLFGASKLHLEIIEVPVHYQERIHGVTKMTKVFSNGLRMLGICWHAWNRLEG
jgi:SAM-dependent methyltransferase